MIEIFLELLIGQHHSFFIDTQLTQIIFYKKAKSENIEFQINRIQKLGFKYVFKFMCIA